MARGHKLPRSQGGKKAPSLSIRATFPFSLSPCPPAFHLHPFAARLWRVATRPRIPYNPPLARSAVALPVGFWPTFSFGREGRFQRGLACWAKRLQSRGA